MTSHELAHDLITLAEHLAARPDTQLTGLNVELLSYAWERDPFVLAVGLLPRPTVKKYGTGYAVINHLLPNGLNISVRILREKVCHKVQDEKWECESVLSEAEIEAIE